MYIFKNLMGDVSEYPRGKVYQELNTTYFMITDKDEIFYGIFARKLSAKDMEGEDRLYPEGYIIFDGEEFPVIVISNSFKTFEEAEIAIKSYKKGFEEIKKIIDNTPETVTEGENTIPKTITYDYLFNYFGGEKYKDKVIGGACVELAIRAYKDGKEIKFLREEDAGYHVPNTNNYYCLSDVFHVSYDREKQFVVQKDLAAAIILMMILPCDKIEYEVVGFTLDYFESEYCTAPMIVEESEFRAFLKSHENDFDISDNVDAQVPSCGMI